MKIVIRGFPGRFFVTGTDTDVGKTLVCAALMTGMKAFYWKPVQSGCVDGTDTKWIQDVTGFPDSMFVPETYRLDLPLSPHAAADHDGVTIDMSEFHLPDISSDSSLIVEGAGGVMVPLNGDFLMKDLIKQLDVPVLVVARSTLGTINHTLLTLSALRAESIPVIGVVLNGEKNPVNRAAIEHYGRVRVVAEIEPIPLIDHAALLDVFAGFSMETS
ncbi:MAG: dethiobiotin synthase [Deltaproteobacteria bacterium]|nr:dethiobiotin synthase [Deltaproteobacteria bacterium]